MYFILCAAIPSYASQLALTVDPLSVNIVAGQPVTYAITVGNTSSTNVPAGIRIDVLLNTPVAAGSIVAANDPSIPNFFSFTIASQSVTAVSQAPLVPGEFLTFTVKFTVNCTAPAGSTLNTVTLIPPTGGPNITVDSSVTAQAGVGISVSSVTQINCFDQSTGAITVQVTGGSTPYNVTLTPNAQPPQSGNGPFFSFSNLPANTYSISAVDQNMCSASTVATVTQPGSALLIVSAEVQDVTCFGVNDGSISVHAAGGTGTITYTLLEPDGNTQTNQEGSFTGLAASTLPYSVVATDANNCTATASQLIIRNQTPLTISVTSSAVSCNSASDGSIIATAQGGSGSYEFTVAGPITVGPQPTGDFIKILPAGPYTVTAADQLNPTGCKVSQQETVANVGAIEPSITATPVSCFGGSDGKLAVSATGGSGSYVFTLKGPVGEEQQTGSTAEFTNLAAGNYTLSVVDANNPNCSAAALMPVVIGQPTQIIVQDPVLIPASCFGGSDGKVIILASGGTAPLKYALDGGTFQTSNVFEGLSAGQHTVAVSDANNCGPVQVNFTISQPSAITITTVTLVAPSCKGSSDGKIIISATGGTSPLTYSIDGGNFFQGSNTFTGLSSGTYNVVVQDANVCRQSGGSFTLSDPSAVSIVSTLFTQPSCNGGSDGTITVLASGGTGSLSYSLNGGPFQSSPKFIGLTAGNYLIIVSDTNGCSATTTVQLTQPAPIIVQNTTSIPVSCFGNSDGSITIIATGGTGQLTFSINGSPFVGSGIFTGLKAGMYTITVRDANGCSALATATVGSPAELVINSVSTTPVKCCGGSDGVIIILANGGVAPLQYSINGGATFQGSNQFKGLKAGTYSIIVRDANGCTASTTATIHTKGGRGNALGNFLARSCETCCSR